jgi:hypothetical protein
MEGNQLIYLHAIFSAERFRVDAPLGQELRAHGWIARSWSGDAQSSPGHNH